MIRICLQAFFILLLSAGFTASWSADFTGARPAAPQPQAEQIKHGLSVGYMHLYFNHVDDLEKREASRVGEPLKNLTHRTKNGNVLTASEPMGVGAHIRGYILLEKTGTYVFRVESNDGVKLKIGGIEMFKDPEIHGNRWSPKLNFQVDQPGWYDFWVNYYQRKGTSALQLVWTPPGATEESPVPHEAFAQLIP